MFVNVHVAKLRIYVVDNEPYDLDPHNYTSGRWLRNDQLERASRYLMFDFDALCRRVLEVCPEAESIASYQKKEGGFNRVFIFTMNTGQRIVARLPFKLAGPSRLTTNSEVATIQHVQSNTSVPIPKILDWSDDASNPIGTEYIIMEHAAGVQLQYRWPTMAGDQKIRFMRALYGKVKEVVNVDFPAYGSLYFAGTRFESASTLPWDHKFCIGPHCGTRYWDCGVGETRDYSSTKPNQGPWKTLPAYCDGLIDSGLSRVPPIDPKRHQRPRYHGSIQDHHHLLEAGRAVVQALARDSRIQASAVPTLHHPDLHKRNIFVSEDEPTIITGIIDWQSASIEPGFWYADDVPDFATPVPKPGSLDQIQPSSELCGKAFEACTQFLTPKLAAARLIEDALFRPFRYCHRTWKDGAVVFRDELIETSKLWKELGLEGSCPYPLPSPQELTAHNKEYAQFKFAHKLKEELSNTLNTATDGWVPSKDFEATKVLSRELYDGLLQAVLSDTDSPDVDDQVTDEQSLREIWPFDL
ncbi:MAG: hypothetical protein M1817_000114 [Caeruleum heppii]|nr:MAG: hypothetical protein M1817_000114 [Caeruleum heppii]